MLWFLLTLFLHWNGKETWLHFALADDLKTVLPNKYVILNMRWLIVTALTQAIFFFEWYWKLSSLEQLAIRCVPTKCQVCHIRIRLRLIGRSWIHKQMIAMEHGKHTWPSQQKELTPLSLYLHFNIAQPLMESLVSFWLRLSAHLYLILYLRDQKPQL